MTMPLLGVALTVACGLAWSGLDAVRKALAERIEPIPLVVLLTAGQAPIFLVWVIWEGSFTPGIGYLLPGTACVLINILANIAFVQAVRVSPLSHTIPFLSFTPVFATLLAVPLVGEQPEVVQVGGIVLVVVGALILTSGGKRRGLVDLWSAFWRERGSVLMTAVALMWSLTAVLDKVAIGHAPIAFHALVQNVGIAALLLVWLGARRRLGSLSPIKRHLGTYLAAVVLSGVALALQLFAIQALLVAVVETVKRAIGMAMSVALGAAIFKEPVTAPKLLAIMLMAGGTAAIVLGGPS